MTVVAPPDLLPSLSLYDAVPGQGRAVEQLRRSAAHPVHAYLFAGPPGTGKQEAALAFAASLLCPRGGDGTCRDCRQALAGTHADLLVVEREGAYIRRKDADEIIRVASRTPVEGRRKVLVLVDFHLVQEVAPMLLKTIEEPPPSTVFVILADHVPAELVTIASRCVRCDFQPLSPEAIEVRLELEGASPEAAAEAARAAGGRIDRARLLVGDPEVAARRALWEGVASRLDGTGSMAAVTAAELLASIDGAKVFDALRQRQAAEVAALEERAALTGERLAKKDLEDRHKREQRRLRTDELRWGLATMAGAYRDRAVGGPSVRTVAAATAAVAAIHRAAEALIRNPNETLLVQSLLIGLQPPG